MLFRLLLLAELGLAPLAPTAAIAQCLGDFNGDARVSIDELLTAVRNALDDCALSGARFVDNGDGTVTDHETGLVWEKKDNLDGQPNLSDPHDADNLYGWSTSGNVPDGPAFTHFLFALNAGISADARTTGGCFASHCDWRLPTSEELLGIVDSTQGSCAGAGTEPCTDPTVGPGQADGYWSATNLTGNIASAWIVDFSGGDAAHGSKTAEFFVRAVRGGR